MSLPPEIMRTVLDSVLLLKSRGLIGPAVTSPVPTTEAAPVASDPWIVRRGHGGSKYWHIHSPKRERIGVFESRDDAELACALRNHYAAMSEAAA